MELLVITSPTPSAESLTDTTNSSFATPPFSLSPVQESMGYSKWNNSEKFQSMALPLPKIRAIELPLPRELVIRRQKSPRNDFGFSLRNAMRVDRLRSQNIPNLKPTIFAEPGTIRDITGLLPGDRLISVNNKSVENMPRESIIDMIRMCEDYVSVSVQPVAELVEISRRCMNIPGDSLDELDQISSNISNCNTLRRSATKRLKNEVILQVMFIAIYMLPKSMPFL